MKRVFTTSGRLPGPLGILLLAGVLLLGTRASAASDAFALVKRAMQTKAEGTYQGRQTIIWSLPAAQGGGTTEIVTALAHRGLHSRLTYLFPPNAAGRVMADDGVQTSLYEPLRRCVLVGPSVSRDMKADRPAMLGLMRQNYTCMVVRRERLSGRMCAVVAIRPRRQDGPYKLCWIDQRQPFVLRLEEYDRAGCRRYVSAYDSIAFSRALPQGALGLPPVARFVPRRLVREISAVSMLPAPSAFWGQAGFAGRLPAWLPHGYALLRLSLLAPQSAGSPLVQIRCSDGLQTLTITESKAAGPMPSSAVLGGVLARYGQQAWVVGCRGVQMIVRGDLSLPPDVGAELASACMPGTEHWLAQAFGHQFGPAFGKQLPLLRQAGWDYVEIVSAALFLRQHPRLMAAFYALLGKQQRWPAVARSLRADAGATDTQARAWIAAAR